MFLPNTFNILVLVLQEGGPLPGPETGLLSNIQQLPEETHVLTKQEIRLGKGTRWRAVGLGEQLCHVAHSLSFIVMGLVSGLSLASHSDSESFLVVHALFSQDGCQ